MREAIRRVLRRPVGVLVASIAVLVMGVLSFLNIPLQLMPDGFEQRHISVHVPLRDSSAAEAERQVAIPLEEAFATVPGVESVSSRSDRGEVEVDLDLKPDATPSDVERDVRDRVARVEADLPEDVDRVQIRRRGASDAPVLFFACIADADRLDLSDFMEDRLLPRIESVDGVAMASAWGQLKRTVRIWLDPEEVARRRLDLRALLQRLRGDNFSADLGDVAAEERTAYVRATMEFSSLDEIRAFPVTEGLTLGEIARVEVVPSLDQGWSRYNGSAVIVGTVYKMSGANTVETCRRVRAQFDAIIAAHPEFKDLEIRAFFDQGAIIEGSLRTLYKNALYGGILAVVLLYGFFRRLRMTLLVAAAIPLSLTIAVTVLYLGGGSLNIATMMGLTLAVGMLIDNAIVVVESILRRRELGDTPAEAAVRGPGEVALAVLTATLTTIAVVLPVFFMSEGDARLWLASICGPIAAALLASLGVALVLVPLGSVYLRRGGKRRRDVADGEGRARGAYGRLLAGALRQRFAIVALGLLLCGSAAIPFGVLGRKGAMGRGGGAIRVALRWPRHYTMSDADQAVRQYEDYVATIRERLGLEGIYARFDRYGGMVMIWKRDDSTMSSEDLREEVRKGWPQVPGVWTNLESTTTGSRTEVTLEGEDPSVLERTLDRIEARLKRLPSVAETQRQRSNSLQELQVRVDPEAVERGLAVPDLIRGMVGWVVRGARLKDYRSEGHDLPLLVELDPDQAVEVGDLGELLIPTAQGPKPLSTLTRTHIRNAAAAIERRDGRRIAELQVTGKKDDDRAFHDEVQAVLAATELPPGVRFRVGGSWEELQQTFTELGLALLLGCVLVFLLTGVLFEAFLLPLAVVVSIPPAIAGGLWGLYVAGKPLDELSILGFILLVGVVVNNAIVLIDRVQQHRAAGMAFRSAVSAAGRDRLRPVVMTAGTTIAGLLPMAVFKGGNDEVPYDTLATVVIGGLVASTLVTLVLVPVVYTLLVDLGRLVWAAFRAALAPARG